MCLIMRLLAQVFIHKRGLYMKFLTRVFDLRSFAVCMAVLWTVAAAVAHGETPSAASPKNETESRPLTELGGEMNNGRLHAIISLLDDKASGEAGYWQLTLEGVPLQVITDEAADRMRIIAPIMNTDDLTKDELFRLMQANFDSALDARYAIAQGILWATFIHPLSTLNDNDFLMGLGQTANIVISYGSTYSSGVLVFRGGDSDELQQQLLERLRRLSDAI